MMTPLARTVLALLSSGTLGGIVASCTASQKAALESDVQRAAQEASRLQPGLERGCSLLETGTTLLDPSAAGAVDLACGSAEAVDAAIALLGPRLVQVQVTGRTFTIEGDGGVSSHYTVRCILPATAITDAGGGHGG